jgi:oxidoreductase
LNKIKVLLLGGGWIAETVYVPFLSEIDEVSEIHVCDLDVVAVTQCFAAWPKVRAVTSSEALDGKFDVACVLTPNYRHAVDILSLLGRVDRLLVEKPFCVKPSEAEGLATAIYHSGTRVVASAPLRYRPDLVALRRDFVQARLGQVYAAEISWLKRKGTPGSLWFTDRTLAGGGVLMDMGPHLLDMSHWLFGREKPLDKLAATSNLFFQGDDVYASWHAGASQTSQLKNVEDSTFAFLRYPTRSLTLSLAWVSRLEKDDARLRIFGTQGVLEVHTAFGFSTETLHLATHVQLSTAESTERCTLDIGDRREPFRPMLHDFILSERCGLPDATEALDMMDDIFGLYTSAGCAS